MKNIVPKRASKEYEQAFAELKQPLTHVAALADANRCLYCSDAPCIKACPTHIDIPTFIKKIATGNLKGSAKTILQSNWIALTCAKACPVAMLCEGSCVYNARGENPIQIGRLQRYAMDDYFAKGMLPLFTAAEPNGKSIGIIGGGPAGLACADELALLGYDVTIYEAKAKAGGLDTWGIAPYKMKQQDSLLEVALSKSLGVKIRTGECVGETVSIQFLMDQHAAIFIGVGLAAASKLNIPGETLAGVYDALAFIEKVTPRQWRSVDVGKRVAVIGGGNTAIDAATEAKRLGAEEVFMIYRRGKSEMPAYLFEQELAKSDGVQFHFQIMPARIIGKKHVEAVECMRTKPGEPDADGRRHPAPIPGSEFRIPVDMVIKSVGQNVEGTFFSQIPDLMIDDGMVVVNHDTLQTSNPMFFAGGDCINGGKEVVNAAHDGKKAAHGIDQWIRSTRQE